ncbi:unnamed protein product [Brassica oleracea var. botrytis]|uniref:(rape) hypothetical protein n=1 Tax=Brassica napus TaxID=3708 RepID=A0A816MHT9_BRANA|nr:unnamed protein product [Brassica napus]
MDSKKFMQMVEEKKRQILEKKEAPLKWEQKLEAAAKAAGTKEKNKHRRHAHSDSDDSNRRKDKKSRRHKRRLSSRSVDSSDEYESGSEDELRKTIKHHRSQALLRDVNNARTQGSEYKYLRKKASLVGHQATPMSLQF